MKDRTAWNRNTLKRVPPGISMALQAIDNRNLRLIKKVVKTLASIYILKRY